MQDLKPLLVFAHLLKNGSMQATGNALGISASAVSQHISRLETQHKVKLLNRSTRHLVPTEVGRELGEYCTKLLYSVNDTLAALENIKTEAIGEVHIGLTSNMVNSPYFQQALTELFEQYPGIHIQLHFSDKLEDLQEGKLDIAIRGGERALNDPNIIAHHLITSNWRIFAAESYLSQHPINYPSDLLAQRWFAFQPINNLLIQDQQEFHLRIDNAIRCDHLLAQQSLIKQGLGLGLGLEIEYLTQLQQREVQIVLPEWKLPPIDIYAVTPYRVQSAKVDKVMSVLKNAFKNVSQSLS